jgi:hypothetical protein
MQSVLSMSPPVGSWSKKRARVGTHRRVSAPAPGRRAREGGAACRSRVDLLWSFIKAI